MKPFNLEEAKKKGVESLIYRNKRKPSDCYIRQDYTGKWVICTWDDIGQYHSHDIGGTHDNDGTSQWDLFMVEEKMWVNMYTRNSSGDIFGGVFYNKEHAIESGKANATYLGTYKLIKE